MSSFGGGVTVGDGGGQATARSPLRSNIYNSPFTTHNSKKDISTNQRFAKKQDSDIIKYIKTLQKHLTKAPGGGVRII